MCARPVLGFHWRAGDAGSVAIGAGSNVQDDAVLGSGDVRVGEGVTIGHGAIIKVRNRRETAIARREGGKEGGRRGMRASHVL